jgi:hypothetical protein
MACNELEVRVWPRRNSRGVVVGRGLVERPVQRAPVSIRECLTIEPLDAAQRGEQIRDGPLAASRVGDREMGQLSGSVVPGDHPIAGFNPLIVARVIGASQSSGNFAPPARGICRYRLELYRISHRSAPTPGNRELNQRCALVI